jgi:hypothetical protein
LVKTAGELDLPVIVVTRTAPTIDIVVSLAGRVTGVQTPRVKGAAEVVAVVSAFPASGRPFQISAACKRAINESMTVIDDRWMASRTERRVFIQYARASVSMMIRTIVPHLETILPIMTGVRPVITTITTGGRLVITIEVLLS